MKEAILNDAKKAIEIENYAFLNFDRIKILLEKDIHTLLDQALYVMLDFAPGSFYWKDKTGRYLGCNQYMLDVNGFTSRSEVIGKTDKDCVWATVARQVNDSDHFVMSSGQTVQFEESAMIHGKYRTFITRKAPLRGKHDEIIGIIGNSIEITDYKIALEAKIRAEQISLLEKKHRASVTNFAGSLAHDLKNNLHTTGLLDEMDELDWVRVKNNNYQLTPALVARFEQRLAKRKENRATMTAQINYSNHTIREIASENPKASFCLINSHKLLYNVLGDAYLAQLDNGTMVIHVQDAAEIWMDSLIFHMVINNLVDNAQREIQEKGKGKIYITGFWANKNDPTKGYIFEVKDTAGGITQEYIDKIFERYKTKDVKGTGIGLKSVLQHLQTLNGNLTVHLVEENCIAFRLHFLPPTTEMLRQQ